MSEPTKKEAVETTEWTSIFDLSEATVLESTVELSPTTKKVAVATFLVTMGFAIGSNMG